MSATAPEPEAAGPPANAPAEPDWVLNEQGLLMATRSFLLRRGYCCGNGCRNCPYAGTPLDRYPGSRPGALGDGSGRTA